jgi:hypothetical protein
VLLLTGIKQTEAVFEFFSILWSDPACGGDVMGESDGHGKKENIGCFYNGLPFTLSRSARLL